MVHAKYRIQKEFTSLANMEFNGFSRSSSTRHIQWHSNMKAAQCAANIKAKILSFNCFHKLVSTPTFNHSIACKNKSGPLGRTQNNGYIQKKLALLNKELGALVTQCHPKMCFTSNCNSRCCRDCFAKIIEVKKCMFPNIKTYLSYL